MNYKFPQYLKGEVYVFSHSGKNLEEGFIKEVAKHIGGEYIGEEFGCICIKTPIGAEEEIGKNLVEKYPDFFTGYERIDIRLRQLWDDTDSIIFEVGVLRDSYTGGVTKKGEFNGMIDKLIEKLKRMKIE